MTKEEGGGEVEVGTENIMRERKKEIGSGGGEDLEVVEEPVMRERKRDLPLEKMEETIEGAIEEALEEGGLGVGKKEKGWVETVMGVQGILVLMIICCVLITTVVFLSYHRVGGEEIEKEEEVFRDLYPLGCLWIGHMSPDTDTVCSAFAAAELFKGTYAVSQTPNKESQFVIKNLSLPSFPIFKPGQENVDCIGIVDHNQQNQSPIKQDNDLDNLQAIIDHHAIQSNVFDLEHILHVNIHPWGSTSSILFQIYKHSHIIPSKQAAGCMLSAILSDTLNLHSPTTTNIDRKNVGELSTLAGIPDVSGYFFEMMKAKSDISEFTVREVILLDSKEYHLEWKDGKQCWILWASFESFDPSSVIESVDEYIEEMRKIKEEKGYDMIFFSVVDIYRAQEANTHISSVFLASETELKIASAAYQKPLVSDSIMDLSPYVSRKKQFIPILDNFLGESDSATYLSPEPTTTKTTTKATAKTTTKASRLLERRKKNQA